MRPKSSHLPLGRREFLAAAAGVAGAAGAGIALGAQDQAAPREFGLDIPPGPVTTGDGRRVTTTDSTGEAVVARLYCEVGDRRVVLLPDGQLVARAGVDAPLTERPFRPMEKGELAKRLTVGPLAGFKSNQTRRYLYIYNTSDLFLLGTTKILESMFPGVAAHYEGLRLGSKTAELPLVVLMFKDQAEYQRYRRMPPGMVAYYNTLDNRVALYEQGELAKVSADIALQQSISMIAHEGVHQILHNIGVQQRLSRWPMWLSEGLAEYFAPTTVGKKLNWKGAGQVNDLRMYELEVYLKRRTGKPDGQMISQTVSAARLTSTGYASAWALTNYLAKNERAAFNKYVAEISELGPFEGSGAVGGPGLIAENLTTFQKHFGSDLAEMEEKLVAHLKKLPYDDPFGEWPHYAATVAAQAPGLPRRQANVFHTAEMARQWQRERLEALPAEARAKAQSAIARFGNRALAEQAAREFLKGR
jgi:hypothetical protein